MSAQNGLPDYYWNNRALLLGVLQDRNKEWKELRHDAYDCVEMNAAAGRQPSEEVHEFLRLRDRSIIESAARRLLGFGERRKVLAVLQQQLGDIADLGDWLSRGEVEEVSSAKIVFQRACDVARWLLDLKLEEFGRMGLDPVALSIMIARVEANIKNDGARTQVRVAEKMLIYCLPLSRQESANDTAGKRRARKAGRELRTGTIVHGARVEAPGSTHRRHRALRGHHGQE
ncbi:MAG: hypothetical protein NTW87_24160 [Planctomycetota bacterium]|nr:hypothetical protein [Planctomycetota bacterium]